MFLVSPCSCLRSIHWSQVVSWEWRCIWSSADRWCSNYIWVINNFIAYWGATYIRGFTVFRWLISYFCHNIITSSKGNIFALLAICAWNSPVPGEVPAQRPVTRSFDVLFGWWFDTLSRPLWRHCNGNCSIISITSLFNLILNGIRPWPHMNYLPYTTA